MGKNTDNNTITTGHLTTGHTENLEKDFIQNFNRISGTQLSVVESDDQIGIDFISRILNSYETQRNIDISSIFKNLGYNDDTSMKVINDNMTISEFDFQGRLYDYYIAPF